MRSQGAKLGGLRSSFIAGEADCLLELRRPENCFDTSTVVGCMRADVGRVSRGFLAGDSRGRVTVEALFRSSFVARLVLDALEIESSIL